ncbi:MAG: putative Solute carrier family 22 member 7 [Streblomastix strix]|uniref:non-specific serine/threonine protein kinase n=1 Tax=Streblomastix strix TaxID=222440 RepID=A0A5J4V9R5_9EUKA|nr:MAG: putative Solute carrier family 22 member 7 [Streblomastix strix]
MTLSNPTSAVVPFKAGDVIKDRYTLIRQIGAGTYGAIFAALYRSSTVARLVAIKLEKDMQKYSLQFNEVAVMKAMAGSSHYAKFYQCGTHEGFKFAIKTLEELHRVGFVHRDVKPDNFVIGNTRETAGIIFLIDFGLCKRLPIQNGQIVKPSQPGNFRGTLRYASVNAHRKRELGRHDDLISLLYMMVEYYTGRLPWSNTNDPV